MSEREADEYLLGTDDDELRRLRFQHVAWTEEQFALGRIAGFGDGDALLDLGCGPGFTSFELARLVGERGSVLACDVSERFLARLAGERDRLRLSNVSTRLGPVETLEVPPESFDGAYARWLFCWLPEPGAALANVYRALRPGGVLALHEYLDWAAMGLLPRSACFDRAVAACMRSWADGGATIDFAREVPRLAAASGFVVERLQPIARVGAVGSLEWRWIGGFFLSYLQKLVAQARFAPADYDEFRAAWARRTDARESFCIAPLMSAIVLRKPRA